MIDEEFAFLSNKIHPRLRLNAICPYFTMFPIDFPYRILSNANKNDTVYDPFCGRGTTNYAARLLGMESYGVDSNPVAQAIAQAKLVDVKPSKIISKCSMILLLNKPIELPVGEFWDWSFDERTLIDICTLRDYFLNKTKLTDTEIALRAIILGVLHGPIMKTEPSYLSNQMPRTFATKPDYSVNYWKTRGLIPNNVNLLQLIRKRSEYIYNDQLPNKTNSKIVLGDSRIIKQISNKKFDWIITSPPYYGMSTYEQDQWLRNWFLGGSSKVQYSVKSQLKHWSERAFTTDLAKVWSNVATKSNPEAKLIIRFGALPSKSDRTPEDLITESLNSASANWEIKKIEVAGKPIESKRQANQFKNSAGKYIEEIDVYAVLKE